MFNFLPSRGGGRDLVVGCWTCNPEVPGSNPPPCHWMDLSSVAPNSTPTRCVNSQLVSLPPVGILNLLCLICIIFCLLRAFEHIHIEFARYKCLLLLLLLLLLLSLCPRFSFIIALTATIKVNHLSVLRDSQAKYKIIFQSQWLSFALVVT